jgi:hypothetical protein
VQCRSNRQDRLHVQMHCPHDCRLAPLDHQALGGSVVC